MNLSLRLPDFRTVCPPNGGVPSEECAHRIAAWRIIDELQLAAANDTCAIEAILAALTIEAVEPAPGAYERLLRENDELRDTLDDIRNRVS